jgi:DEAD/DEAH box helicase
MDSTQITAPTTKKPNEETSRDRTGKRDDSEQKQELVHRESIAAFRSSMSIKLTSHYGVPDPIASFKELSTPSWCDDLSSTYRTILQNIEAGKWKEPTSMQMQAIPAIMERKDFIGCAPTGSGKSGAFIVPALLLSSVSDVIFYGVPNTDSNDGKKKSKKKKSPSAPTQKPNKAKSGLSFWHLPGNLLLSCIAKLNVLVSGSREDYIHCYWSGPMHQTSFLDRPAAKRA